MWLTSRQETALRLACAAAGIVFDPGYSGEGMAGMRCVAIAGPAWGIALITGRLRDHGHHALADLLLRRPFRLGDHPLDTVTYWPGISAPGGWLTEEDTA